jgi:hypothetical protein
MIFRSAPLLLAFILGSISTLSAQSPPLLDAVPLYQQLQNASVLDKSVHLENLVLQRDRVTITFTDGIAYLSPPIAGKVRSAVFIGSGKLHATPPPVAFEQDNVRRLLKADDVSATSKLQFCGSRTIPPTNFSSRVFFRVGPLRSRPHILRSSSRRVC